jgi:outer membrane receptor protein involved in Fe transport
MAICLMVWLMPAAAREEGSMTLISAEEIARERPASLFSLLRSRVGLDIIGSRVSMRGVQGVVFVLDGFTVSAVEVSQVRPEQVKRIEIRRGAASAEYGAEAMGGAVEIFTTQTEAQVSRRLDLGVDASGSRFVRLDGREGTGAFSLSGLLEHRLVDGYRRVTESPYAYNVTVEDERYEKWLLDGSLGWRQSTTQLGLNLKYRKNLSNLGRPHWWWDDSETSLRGTGRWEAVPGWRIEARLGWLDYNDEAQKDKGTGVSGEGLEPALRLFTSESRREGELVLKKTLLGGVFESALSASRTRHSDRILDVAAGGESFHLNVTTDNLALSGDWEGELSSAHHIQLGLRYDRYRYQEIEVYNRASLPAFFRGEPVTLGAYNAKVALGWPVLSVARFDFSLGSGFLPPSPEQLYYTELNSASWFIPNTQLDPQRSVTLDATLAFEPKAGTVWKLTAFHTRWRNKIGVSIVDYGAPVVRQFQNIGAAQSSGLELEAQRALGRHLTLSLNSTFNRTRIIENQAHPEYLGNELPDMPRLKLNLGLDWQRGDRWSGRLSFRYVGETWSDEANNTVDSRGIDWRKPSYTTMDVNVIGRWDGLELVLAGDNLMDRRYLSGFFWQDEGRIWRAELSWRF